MDVLHITEACGAGVRRHLGLILPALRSRGIACGLFAFGSRFEDGFIDEFSGIGLEDVLFQQDGASRIVSLVNAAKRIRRLCREREPRVIHCHAFSAGVAARMAAPRGTRLLYSPHAFSVNRRIAFPKRCIAAISEHILRGRTDGYVLVGPGELEDAASIGIPESRIHCVFNGLPESILDEMLAQDAARAALGIPKDVKAVVAPCRLEAQKGLPQLITAWRGISGNATLHIFGEGTMRRELEAQITANSLAGRVFLHGVQPNLHRFLRAFDAGVLPSLYEGLSYSLLEMLAAGIPVVASDIPANRIDNGICFFRIGDGDSLSAAIRNSLSVGTRKATFPYALERQVDALVDLYKL